MKKHFLKSTTDFVLEINKEFEKPTKIFDKNKQFERMLSYAKFLKQPLALGMFIPCDLDNNVLNKYITEPYDRNKNYDLNMFEQAQERVLFKNVSIKEHGRVVVLDYRGREITIANTKIGVMPMMIIEDLVIQGFELTDNAAKMLGYEVV